MGSSTDNSPPEVDDIVVNSATSIALYSMNPLLNLVRKNTGSYQIDQGIFVSSPVLQEDQRTVNLTISEIVAGQDYNIFINGIQNLSGIDITPGESNL